MKISLFLIWRRDVWYKPTGISEELANYVICINDLGNRDNIPRNVGIYLQDLFGVTSITTLNHKAYWRFRFFTLTLPFIYTYTRAEQHVACGEHAAFSGLNTLNSTV
jgi:hypothetical protein